MIAQTKEQKKYLITGGSGFIGRQLCWRLIDEGHSVTVLSRNHQTTNELFKGQVRLCKSFDELASDIYFDGVINLAGEPLANSRWNKKSKAKFIDSRVGMTQLLESFIKKLKRPPKVLINGSAIGFYGLRGDKMLSETELGKDCYSHRLCRAWEAAATKIERLDVRVCLLRTGIVLGKGAGPMAKLLPPFQLGLGGPIASGRQWMSWIHIDDLVAIILFALENEHLSGPINGVSPNPERNRDFAKILGKQLHRPAILPMPGFVLRLLVGEMAEELLINGQRVVPKKLLEAGFQFNYIQLEQALAQILKP